MTLKIQPKLIYLEVKKKSTPQLKIKKIINLLLGFLISVISENKNYKMSISYRRQFRQLLN